MRAFMGANIGDALSTFAALNAGAMEGNPLIASAIEATSVPVVLAVKLMMALVIALVVTRWKPRLLTIPTLAFALLAISNSLIRLGQL